MRLRRILFKALGKDPKQRFNTVEDFLNDLRNLIEEKTSNNKLGFFNNQYIFLFGLLILLISVDVYFYNNSNIRAFIEKLSNEKVETIENLDFVSNQGSYGRTIWYIY